MFASIALYGLKKSNGTLLLKIMQKNSKQFENAQWLKGTIVKYSLDKYGPYSCRSKKRQCIWLKFLSPKQTLTFPYNYCDNQFYSKRVWGMFEFQFLKFCNLTI